MTPQQIKDNAPSGATHYDEQDYWKYKDNAWYIWLESCSKWRRIFGYQRFHAQLPVNPL